MAYRDFRDLPKRAASKAFNIAKNSKYDGYQRGLASIVYKFKSLLLGAHGQRTLLSEINLLVVLLKVRLCQTIN